MSVKDLDMCEFNSHFLEFICMIIADTNSQNKQIAKGNDAFDINEFFKDALFTRYTQFAAPEKRQLKRNSLG